MSSAGTLPAILFAMLIALAGCSSKFPNQSKSSQSTLYVANDIGEPMSVMIGRVTFEVPAKSIRSIPLMECCAPEDIFATVLFGSSAHKSSEIGSIDIQVPKTGNVDVVIGSKRVLDDADRGRSAPAEVRTWNATSGQTAQLTSAPSEQKRAEDQQSILVTSHPRLRTSVNSIGMTMIEVLPGEFLMGCLPTEPGWTLPEQQHQVRLSRPFWLGETEVTQRQWKEVMGSNPSEVKGDDFPVNSISWSEAVEFCERLSAREGRHYRLPTEAEWEFACRAGTQTMYSFGDDPKALPEFGWFNLNSTGLPEPARGKKPNPWGFYDLHGNVEEWCADWGGVRYPTGKQVDPQGPAVGTERVSRGGRCNFGPDLCGSTARNWMPPDSRYGSLGMRVAMDPEGSVTGVR